VQGLVSFSLPRFLRRVQPSDLQRYFAARDIPFSEQVDWTAKPVALLPQSFRLLGCLVVHPVLSQNSDVASARLFADPG
jgi:hypothetical protein